VEAFRFVAGIAQQVPQGLVGQSRPDRGAGFREIGLGTPIDRAAENQMVGRIPDGRELGIAALVVAVVALTAFCVVGGDRARLQTGRVDRGPGGAFPQNLGLAAALQDAVQEGLRFRFRQQTFAGGPQGGKMRHLLQAQDVPQLGPFLQQDPDTPVVQAPEFLHDQTGEQLGLGELLGALGTAIVGQALLAGFQRLSRNG
jgi:hypothetical protein